jgi:hypothetical protein
MKESNKDPGDVKRHFKDPIAVKEGKTIKNPNNHHQLPYDQRSSCFVNMGTNYGFGHNQPIGKFKISKPPVVPQKSARYESDYVDHGASNELFTHEAE